MFVLFAMACWVHTGFVSVRIAGIWWGSQKDFCPVTTPRMILALYFVPAALGAVVAFSRRSAFIANVPLIAWFGCWSAAHVAVAGAVTLAPIVPGLIPHCVKWP